jgi:hypothetical protein
VTFNERFVCESVAILDCTFYPHPSSQLSPKGEYLTTKICVRFKECSSVIASDNANLSPFGEKARPTQNKWQSLFFKVI